MWRLAFGEIDRIIWAFAGTRSIGELDRAAIDNVHESLQSPSGSAWRKPLDDVKFWDGKYEIGINLYAKMEIVKFICNHESMWTRPPTEPPLV